MLVYSVSYFSNDSRMSCVNGVWCICSSLEKAHKAIDTYMTKYSEKLIDMQESINGIQTYYTTDGRYIVECVELDDV